MKELKLTQGYVAIVDDDDFDRVSKFHWQAKVARRKDGSIKTVYGQRVDRSKPKETTVMLHRYILGLTDRRLDCDHRNHDGLDNRRSNLRVSTKSQNAANRVVPLGNTSGFKGVRKVNRTKCWRVTIGFNNKKISLGEYSTRREAVSAYNEAAKKYFGEFATTQVCC